MKDELAVALGAVRHNARAWQTYDGIDVRLQVTGNGWALHTGDPGYDTDHHGVWGVDCVFPDSNNHDLREMAERLIAECRESESQMAD